MLALGLTLAPAGSLARPEAASADSGFITVCYAMRGDANNGGGWCDGNGPDATYFGFAWCTAFDGSGSYKEFGVQRWAGDRRGSYASCPVGFYEAGTGVEGYFHDWAQVAVCDVGGAWYRECPVYAYM
jgi:hypothetical protein